jgi:SAM-dependent methyltransferase
MMKALKTWAADQSEENAMNDDHRHLWRQMILHMEERDLTDASVLDFGCNQGGFLRMLYRMKSYLSGYGVDLAEASLEIARKQVRSTEPITFGHTDTLADKAEKFDIAFSHEVLYLLPDLAAHAQTIKNVLKPGGIYYAAIGCHTQNPQWERWRGLIAEYSNVPVQDYSLDDYANAFYAEGFSVSAKPYRFDGFVPLKKENPYFPSLRDSLDYHSTHKTLFRFRKEGI